MMTFHIAQLPRLCTRSGPGSSLGSTSYLGVARPQLLTNGPSYRAHYFKPFRTGSLHAACPPKLRSRMPPISASAVSSSSGRTESSNLATVYTSLAAALAASAAARLTHPQWYAELAHDACPNGLAAGLIRLTGATLIPIAAALWTLKGAAEHDRLASNTYRRLNLGLAAWAAANLTLLAKGAAAHVVTWCSGVQTAVYLAAIAACGYAWSTSTGYAPTGRQIIDGISDDISALLNNKTWLSGVLSLASVAAASFGILTLAEPFQYFQPEAFRVLDGMLGSWYMRSYSINLLFGVVVLTTLKDALDRDRHTASTFKLLAKAALATAVAEIGTFYLTGQTPGIIRELVFGVVMGAYLSKE